MNSEPFPNWITTACLALLLAVGGCSDDSGDDDESTSLGDDGNPSSGSQDDDGVTPLLGCKNPDNWTCPTPSPGFEFGCVAVCNGAIELTCNQSFEGGGCILAPSGETCAVPETGEGCDICRTAITNQCASIIPTDP